MYLSSEHSKAYVLERAYAGETLAQVADLKDDWIGRRGSSHP
jgi:hypothetical protein